MDYEKIFSPMAKMTIVHNLIVVTSIFQRKIFQMDVKNVSLNEVLHEEVYMTPPLDVSHKCGDMVKFANFKMPIMVLIKHLVLGFISFLH